MKIGVHTIPKFPKDTTDRNRTSPFAFTGNKFEFRMPGSAASISGPNTVINTAVAESLKQYADELEGAKDFETALHHLIHRVIHAHKRIIFNGNGYDDAWLAEAAQRGLSNLPSLPDCTPCMLAEKNVALYENHKVFSRVEIEARYEIRLEKYVKVLSIEALTMVDMARKEILPAAASFARSLAQGIAAQKEAVPGLTCPYEEETLKALNEHIAGAYAALGTLEDTLAQAKEIQEPLAQAQFYHGSVIPAMDALRDHADQLETHTAKDFWPYPTYGDLLFSVK
jgi:glutamine synthetase